MSDVMTLMQWVDAVAAGQRQIEEVPESIRHLVAIKVMNTGTEFGRIAYERYRDGSVMDVSKEEMEQLGKDVIKGITKQLNGLD